MKYSAHKFCEMQASTATNSVSVVLLVFRSSSILCDLSCHDPQHVHHPDTSIYFLYRLFPKLEVNICVALRYCIILVNFLKPSVSDSFILVHRNDVAVCTSGLPLWDRNSNFAAGECFSPFVSSAN